MLIRALVVTALTIIGAGVFLAPPARAHPAWGIAVDRQGQVYFSDLEIVWKIDAQGRLSVFRASVGGRHVHELNTDEAGNLYGADNSYEPATRRFFSALWKMTPTGGFSYLLAPTDDPPEGTSIWRDREGNTYHATTHPGRELMVIKRTPNGKVNVLVGDSKAAREYRQGVPYSLGGMAFDNEGSLYFTHGANVSKLTMNGTVSVLARNLVTEATPGNTASVASQTQLFGLAVDAQGNAVVADYGNRRVLKITPQGQVTTLLRAEETWFPTGVANRDGELYILENGHTPAYRPTGTRVRKLSADGRVTLLATVGENGNPRGGSSSPTVVESSSGESSETKSEPGRRALSLLLGAAAAIFALTIIVWRVRRRMSKRQRRELLKQ
jgi:hypothetical protein